MKLKRRFPNYFSGFEKEKTEHEVTNKEEFENIEWIKDLMDNDGFLRFGYFKSTFEDTPTALMTFSESSDKEKFPRGIFFVVGYIWGDPEELGITFNFNEI